MAELALDDRSISALYKLDIEFKRATGLHHRLSSESAILDLIKKAFVSQSPKIKAAYLEFIDTLNIQQKTKLNDEGIVPIRLNSLSNNNSKNGFLKQLFGFGKSA